MDEHRAMIRTAVIRPSMCAVVVLFMAPFWRTLVTALKTQHPQMLCI